MVKNLPANAGDARDADSVPGSGRSSGSCSCLGNSRDRGATEHVCDILIEECTKSDEFL